MIRVADLMTPAVSRARVNDHLSDAVTTMRTNRHSCVLVADNNRIKGILTERDLVGVLAGALSEGRLENLPVYAVMTPDPVCVRRDNTLSEALTLALEKRLRHLPVISEDGCLLGVVTQTDMIHAYVKLLEEQALLTLDNETLQAQSREDPLLGIGNRRAMEVDLERVTATAQRSGQPYAVALLDVDWFKKYNDRLGHLAGDRALQRVVTAIAAIMREGDSLYRFGGEELVMLMPNTDLDGGRQALERARAAVQGLGIVHSDSPLSVLTVSAGVASGSGVDWKQLIAAADWAMYRAKNRGRNRVQVARKGEFSGSGDESPRYNA